MAEDNPVNQQLALRLLQKEGHTVELACNGDEAVRLCRQKSFDCILMDVQMPEMDGFEATRCIREEQKERGRHVSIIAMTAHAMKGDRERCLAAGMDGYIAKPISKGDLRNALNTYSAVKALPQPAAAPPTNGSVLDADAALGLVGGDKQLLAQLCATFLNQSPALLRSLREAVAAGAASDVYRSAHTLKGSITIFAAHRAAEAALRLEQMGRNQDLQDAIAALDALSRELALLEPALAELRRRIEG